MVWTPTSVILSPLGIGSSATLNAIQGVDCRRINCCLWLPSGPACCRRESHTPSKDACHSCFRQLVNTGCLDYHSKITANVANTLGSSLRFQIDALALRTLRCCDVTLSSSGRAPYHLDKPRTTWHQPDLPFRSFQRLHRPRRSCGLAAPARKTNMQHVRQSKTLLGLCRRLQGATQGGLKKATSVCLVAITATKDQKISKG